MREVILSGIRATGKLHLGNFLGVLRNFARFSIDPKYKCYFFIADWHTLTTLKDAEQIKDSLSNIVLDYLAAGVDPEKAAIFLQSSVTETTELFWILSCLTPKVLLDRMPTFKEKAKLHSENINAGLFNYPVLMAADILGPRANLVPVGKDQKPHLELAVEIARRFNNLYGETFPIPQSMGQKMIIVPGLDGSGKMGKSEGNTINLDDSPEGIRTKLKIAVTDTNRKRRSDSGNPYVCNIFALHELVSSQEEIGYCASGCQKAKIGCVDCKNILSTNIINTLEPFQERRKDLEGKKNLVEEILLSGNEQARKVISSTVTEIREKVGITSYNMPRR